MEHAKSGRAARPVWFDGGMERALIAQSEIEQGIRYGLEHDQFVPFFEPQLDLETGEIVGFEVLARWIHPLSGTILPDNFIPVAEEIGLIGRLSEKVIGDALTQAVDWDPAIKISVNISPVQLTDAWLAQRIVRLLTEIGFPAERLVVEITESSLFADIDLARSIVTSLKNQGIRLALDDFGTGFSSLSHLRSLPFDVIKIDRSFVANIHSNNGKQRHHPRRDDARQRAQRSGLCRGHRDRGRPRRRARARLRGRPGLVFRQADDRRAGGPAARPARPAGVPGRRASPPPAEFPFHLAEPAVPRRDGGIRCAAERGCRHGKNRIKTCEWLSLAPLPSRPGPPAAFATALAAFAAPRPRPGARCAPASPPR